MEKKITITINDETLKGLNNAIAAYGNLCYSIFLGASIPTEFEKLQELSDEELRARFDAVKTLYAELEKQYKE